MPILLQATATAPGEARVEIRGANIANQEIEISIRRGSDESFIGGDGAWQAQPHWHRLHRLPEQGIAFSAGPALVDALAEVASGDAFGATVRWDGGGPEDGVLRIKGELITRPPDGPVPTAARLISIEIQGVIIPADVRTIELAPAQTSTGQPESWCRLERAAGEMATGFQCAANAMEALITLTTRAPSRARVRWGSLTRDGELRPHPQSADSAGGSDKNGPRFLMVLDPEPMRPLDPEVPTPAKTRFASPRALAWGGAGLFALLGVGALAAWLMSEPAPDPESDPGVAEVSPETPPAPTDPIPPDGTPSKEEDLVIEPDHQPGSGASAVDGGGEVATGLEIEPETPPVAPPSPFTPAPPPEGVTEVDTSDVETSEIVKEIETTAQDPDAYRSRVERIKEAARPNCGELLLLHSKAASAHPEIAATVAQLYDPLGFKPSTCIDRPNAEQAMNYYSLAAEGGIAEAEVALQRLLGPSPTDLGAPMEPATGESLRRIENRP